MFYIHNFQEGVFVLFLSCRHYLCMASFQQHQAECILNRSILPVLYKCWQPKDSLNNIFQPIQFILPFRCQEH